MYRKHYTIAVNLPAICHIESRKGTRLPFGTGEAQPRRESYAGPRDAGQRRATSATNGVALPSQTRELRGVALPSFVIYDLYAKGVRLPSTSRFSPRLRIPKFRAKHGSVRRIRAKLGSAKGATKPANDRRFRFF